MERTERLKRGFLKRIKKRFFKRRSVLIPSINRHVPEVDLINDQLFEFHESLSTFGEEFKNSIEKSKKDSTRFHHEFDLPLPAKPDIMDSPAAYKHFLDLRNTEKKCFENGKPCKFISLFFSISKIKKPF